jgi:hypothetical protein
MADDFFKRFKSENQLCRNLAHVCFAPQFSEDNGQLAFPAIFRAEADAPLPQQQKLRWKSKELVHKPQSKRRPNILPAR